MTSPDRLALGTLCNVLDADCDPDGVGIREVVATVVGTWAFTGASGMPGTVETRERRFRSDPRSDETAKGYLLLPSGRPGFFYVPFGAVHTGDLVAIT
jgi:hypothetical protein